MKIFLAIFFLVYGCEIFAQYTANDYFPLKVGNKWYYTHFSRNGNIDSTDICEVWEVISERELEGKKFYLVKKNKFRVQRNY